MCIACCAYKPLFEAARDIANTAVTSLEEVSKQRDNLAVELEEARKVISSFLSSMQGE